MMQKFAAFYFLNLKLKRPMREKINIQEEKKLIASCLSGDKKAWDQLVEKYSKLVYNRIYLTLEAKGWIPEPHLVEDLFQEIFLAILRNDFKKLRQFGWKNDCSFATWFSVITDNLVLDFIRKESKSAGRTESIHKEINPESKETLLDTLEDHSANIRDILSKQELSHCLKEAMATLDEEGKTLLDLLFYQQLPFEVIASLTGKSIDALYMQKKRLIDKLRNFLKNRVGF